MSSVLSRIDLAWPVAEHKAYMDTEWECMECGYLHEGKAPPRACPDCGTTGVWERVELVDDWGDEELDEDETNELDELDGS